jgi:sugar/nucleoside kinase (ribokinase family)
VIKRGAAGAGAAQGARRWHIKASKSEPVDIAGVGDPVVAALLNESERRFPVNNRATLEVVDTTGAGDAFVAGFLAARIEGAEIVAALTRAVVAGSKAAVKVGGRPRVPR